MVAPVGVARLGPIVLKKRLNYTIDFWSLKHEPISEHILFWSAFYPHGLWACDSFPRHWPNFSVPRFKRYGPAKHRPDSADVVVAYGCEFQLIRPEIACFWRLIALNGAILGYRWIGIILRWILYRLVLTLPFDMWYSTIELVDDPTITSKADKLLVWTDFIEPIPMRL